MRATPTGTVVVHASDAGVAPALDHSPRSVRPAVGRPFVDWSPRVVPVVVSEGSEVIRVRERGIEEGIVASVTVAPATPAAISLALHGELLRKRDGDHEVDDGRRDGRLGEPHETLAVEWKASSPLEKGGFHHLGSDSRRRFDDVLEAHRSRGEASFGGRSHLLVRKGRHTGAGDFVARCPEAPDQNGPPVSAHRSIAARPR